MVATPIPMSSRVAAIIPQSMLNSRRRSIAMRYSSACRVARGATARAPARRPRGGGRHGGAGRRRHAEEMGEDLSGDGGRGLAAGRAVLHHHRDGDGGGGGGGGGAGA